MPDVFRAEIDITEFEKKQTRYMPTIPDIPVCPEEFIPPLEWEKELLSSFSDLRTVSIS
jgi:hypothetical protein